MATTIVDKSTFSYITRKNEPIELKNYTSNFTMPATQLSFLERYDHITTAYLQKEPIDDYLPQFSALWVSIGEESVGAPTLRAPKCFTYDELKECTNGFRETNKIGVGGYGKVGKSTDFYLMQ